MSVAVKVRLNLRLTVDIALALVRLCHKKVRHMSSNAVLVRDSVSTKHFLEPVAS
jgi:hypothetical protein